MVVIAFSVLYNSFRFFEYGICEKSLKNSTIYYEHGISKNTSNFIEEPITLPEEEILTDEYIDYPCEPVSIVKLIQLNFAVKLRNDIIRVIKNSFI